jgi:hypothetical protein
MTSALLSASALRPDAATSAKWRYLVEEEQQRHQRVSGRGNAAVRTDAPHADGRSIARPASLRCRKNARFTVTGGRPLGSTPIAIIQNMHPFGHEMTTLVDHRSREETVSRVRLGRALRTCRRALPGRGSAVPKATRSHTGSGQRRRANGVQDGNAND